MKRFFYLIIVFFIIGGISTELLPNYQVSNYLDLPDEDLNDNIYFPQTLRSAIQNANKKGVPTIITFASDTAKIKLQSNLPAINVQVVFEGDGLTLEPLNGANVNNGLAITGNFSHLSKVIIKNFKSSGLVWQGDDGLIENVTSIDNGGPGISMSYANRNRIGSNNFTNYASNYFYGATGDGGHGILLVLSNDNIIEYCAIGHNSNSDAKPNSREGINLSESYRTIIRNNVISGNDWNGIYIDADNNESNSLIENNIIGLDRLKLTGIPNKMCGIYLFSTKGDTIRNNIVSGNFDTGIYIANQTCDGITIENNIVGTDKTTRIAVPNGSGIRTNGTNQKILNNIISGNTYTGLSVSTTGEIKNNIIGLDSTQQFAVPNNTGVYIIGVNISFGNLKWEDANIIAGNTGTGIEIVGAATKNISITQNIIGINQDYSRIFPNGGSGIKMTHSLRDVTIDYNIIASSGLHGIEMIRNVVIFLDTLIPHKYQKPNNIIVKNNLIGWTQNENDFARIGGSGIYMYSVDSINVYNNLITSTDYSGIYLGNDSSRFVNIYANDIGHTNNNQGKRIKGSGIFIENAHDIYIGGIRDTTDYNYIQNCDYSGIFIDKADSVVIINNVMHSLGQDGISIIGDSVRQNIKITKNTIGPVDDVEDAKIQFSGIYVYRGFDIEIGDIIDDDGYNIISYCKDFGIHVTDSSQEVYSHANRFINNANGGIALDSVIKWYFVHGNFNDNLDTDIGSNGLQNTLNTEISKAEGDSLRLKAYFRGKKETIYGVELYLAKKLPENIKYQTQGDTYIDRFNIVTDALGNAEIDKILKSTKIADKSAELPYVTALVYGAEGTSCFSNTTYVTNILRDIKIVIDTSKSKMDEFGVITIESNISNIGNTIESNIQVRDTASGVNLLEAELSSGITSISDNIFMGNIPELKPGESVKFITKSKAKTVGIHKRYVYAITEEPDMNILNNIDSIQFNVISDVKVNDTIIPSNITLEVVPNPASDYIEIEFNTNNCKASELKIYSLEGKLVSDLSNKLVDSKNNKLTQNVSSFRAGEYNIILTCGNERAIKKIVVIK